MAITLNQVQRALNQGRFEGASPSTIPKDATDKDAVLVDRFGNKRAAFPENDAVKMPVFGTEVLSDEEAERVRNAPAHAAVFDEPEAAKDHTEYADAEVAPVQGEQDSEAEPAPEKTHQQRYDELDFAIRRQPGHREIFFKVLDYCNERRVLSDIESTIASYPEFKLATFDQYMFVQILERHGGLDRFEMDENDQVVTPEMKEGLTEDEVDDLVAYYAFQTTDLGREMLAANDPVDRINKLLGAIPQRKQTYLDVLDFCKEGKRSYNEIKELLDGRDVLWFGRENKQQALQPSVFVDKLERAGGIVWNDGWQITRKGRKVLEQLTAEAVR